MKANKLIHLACYFLCLPFLAFSQIKTTKKNRIVVVEGPLQSRSGFATIGIYPFRHDSFDPWVVKEVKAPIVDGFVKLEFSSNVPVTLRNNALSKWMAYLIEPGDSVHIQHMGQTMVFSGRGSEKFRLGKLVDDLIQDIRMSPEKGLSEGSQQPASSLEDYLHWNDYLNRKTKEWNQLLDNSKGKISELSYLDLKDRALRHIEKVRMHKFHTIRRSNVVAEKNQFGLTNEDLCRIYDSTMDNASSKWLRYGRNYVFSADYPWEILHDEDYRRRGKFFRTSESDPPIFEDEADVYVSKYNMIKEKFTGIVRENLLSYTFYDDNAALRRVGFVPKIEAILADYYATPGYPEFKQKVREYEAERREKWNLENAPAFSLIDSKGNSFTDEQLKGKIAVMDFWFTGCKGCVQMAPALRKVEKYFERDTNIVFMSISIDKNKEQWLKSVKQGRYTSGGGIQLYTGGEGDDHAVVKKLLVSGYPALEVIDPYGMLVKYDKKNIDPRYNEGKTMIASLEKLLASLKDGPYVFHDRNQSTVYTIDKNTIDRNTTDKVQQVKVQTDGPGTFQVTLKSSHNNEAFEYRRPDKLFVLSDIEGNFDQFRKLLQANKIIDADYNWKFGEGHLVFAGDMFDRGQQVTECLWLIYSLEEKAKKSGGYVHFVLGNHEIMNLQGDHSDVQKKYANNANLMNKTLTQLYGENSELGRWLRTKNIVEKIGNILFLHGGISPKVNRSSLTLADINQLARPNYAVNKPKADYGDEKTTLIMHPRTSPFWYREYYYADESPLKFIDSVLQKFEVNHIVTGHSIVADTISTWYNNRVINTDTKHAQGKSEALLIEGERYYRVNAVGRKVLLFREEKRNVAVRKEDSQDVIPGTR